MYFVYRSWYEGPLSKLVRHYPGLSVLDWFRRSWYEAAGEDAYEWVRREFGTDVYGLGSIFETGEPAPESMAELRRLMREHLYYEEELRVDDHSVRVLTNDDDVKLAYYFADDALVLAEPERWAYPVWEEGWRLPDTPADQGRTFEPPVPPIRTELSHAGQVGVTYAVILDFPDGDRSAGGLRPTVLPGVRLPELAAALRESDADPERWDEELLTLRALTAPGEERIGAALERRNRWPDESIPESAAARRRHLAALARPHQEAHARALRLLNGFTPEDERDPGRTLIHLGDHLAQMCVHSGYFGHAQWFLFDDLWAAAHSDLAASLIHYAGHWDPGCARRHPLHAPCQDDAYLEIELNDGYIVRDYEPYDEPGMVSMAAALEAAGEHAERDGLREALADTRVLLVADRPRRGNPGLGLMGVIAVRLHRPEPGTCEVSAFVIRPDLRGRQLALPTAARLWHELRALDVDRLAFTMPRNPGGMALVRRLTGLTEDVRPGSRVEVPLERVRRSTNRAWMTEGTPRT
ncbi:hypothetical protein ACFWY5_48980 [Nonomuraea sp. NPDC059007]|uniref:hypothetical protein n=1 Tax=Nonomuraea sp. NPDC059007 TaxID=3346692 RepID=UPI003697B35D